MQMDTAILPPILQITPESMSVDWTLPGGQSKPLADLADTVVDLWTGDTFLSRTNYASYRRDQYYFGATNLSRDQSLHCLKYVTLGVAQ